MFSKKLGLALVTVMFFLATAAFIMGKPPHKDARIYPIVSKYAPFVVENGLGGLKIKRKDDPNFKEEPDAVNFYKRLQFLEQEWAKNHLQLKDMELLIMDNNQSIIKRVPLNTQSEKRFVIEYYGVGK